MRRTKRWFPLVGGLALLAALVPREAESAEEPRYLTVQGIGRGLGETPLVVEVFDDLRPGDYALESMDGRKSLVANIFLDGGKRYLGTILDGLGALELLTYQVRPDSTPGPTPGGVELIPEGGRIHVKVDGRPLTDYVADDGPKPYFFPLFGPSGAAMTRAFPMKQVAGETKDHPHHRSFWFTHGSVNKVDFWTEGVNHGRIVETSRPTVTGGAAVGTLRTRDDWIGPDGKKVCEDERVLRVYATRKGRVLDVDVTLKATEGPVTFGDTKEGMFGLRVASSMDVTAKPGGKILNAEGVEDKAAWGKASPWVDYSGPLDGKTTGIAILNHPSSFRYPTTWHVRDYGLFAANPFGWHDFGLKGSGEHVLPQGQSIRFGYRLILHEGGAVDQKLPEAFAGYAKGPAVAYWHPAPWTSRKSKGR